MDITLTATPRPEHPERVGPCRLLSRLGSGGMGTVFLGEMVEERAWAAPGSRVAVKLLRTRSAFSEDDLTRFRREAAIGNAVEGDAVARTFEWGERLPDGTLCPWLVMELVEGRSVRELADEIGRLPEPLVRHLGARIARALAGLHRQGAVHRDVKPANVVITPDQRVKLMDFGIARSLSDFSDLTQTGEFVGTLRYAAPEQLQGLRVGPATDLYSLGVMLYEGATGVVPFGDLAPGALFDARRAGRFTRASAHHDDLSPLLDELISCLLEPQPEARPGGATLVAEILETGESHAWWAEREADAAARPVRRRVHLSVERATAMVGRDDLLAQLLDGVASAIAGAGSSVLLRAEPGAGKTRLLSELLHECEQRGLAIDVLAVTHAPGDRGGLDAIHRAIVSHFGVRQLPSALRRLVTRTPQLIPAWLAVLLPDEARAGEDALAREALTPEAAGDLALQVLAGLARERAVLLIVEDLHHASPLERALIVEMARQAPSARLVLACTSRPDLDQAAVSALQSASARIIDVGRLRVADVQRLLELTFGSESLARSLAAPLAQRSDGNPLFLFSLLDELRERQVIEPSQGGSWRVRGAADSLGVPASIAALLKARLDALPEDLRQAIDAAAVQGFEFDAGLVARALGRDPLHVLQALAFAERRTGIVSGAGASFRFDHHLLQEAAVAAMPPALRAELHARLADALEQGEPLPAGRPATGELAVRLAHHWLRGGRAARAMPHLLPALEHLDRRLDPHAMVALAALVQETLGEADPFASTPGSAPERGARRERQVLWNLYCASAMYQCGDLDAAARLAMRTLELAGSPMPQSADVRPSALLAPALRQAMHLALPRRLTRSPRASRRRIHAAAAEAAGIVALCAMMRGHLGGVLAGALASQNLAERAGHDDALALGFLGGAANGLGLRRLARSYFARGKRASANRPRAHVDVCLFEVDGLFGDGLVAEAARRLDGIEATCAGAGYPLRASRASLGRASIALAHGRYADARAHFQRGQVVVAGASIGVHETFLELGLLLALVGLGSGEEARERLAALAGELPGDGIVAAVHAGIAATAALECGRLDDAREQAVRAVSLVEGNEMTLLSGLDAPLQISTHVLQEIWERALLANAGEASALQAEATRALVGQRAWASRYRLRRPRLLLHEARHLRLCGAPRADALSRVEAASTSAAHVGLPLDQALGLMERARHESPGSPGRRQHLSGALALLDVAQAPMLRRACSDLAATGSGESGPGVDETVAGPRRR